MVNRKRVRRMQIDLKAAEGEIGVNMIIKLSFQIQFINRNEKIGGWSFLILGSSCKSRGSEIYLWTDPACWQFGSHNDRAEPSIDDGKLDDGSKDMLLKCLETNTYQLMSCGYGYPQSIRMG